MKQLTIRCSDEEYEILMRYCKKVERTQNAVVRERIRLIVTEPIAVSVATRE